MTVQTTDRVHRIPVPLRNDAELAAVKAAAKADDRSVGKWARLILLDAAEAAGYPLTEQE